MRVGPLLVAVAPSTLKDFGAVALEATAAARQSASSRQLSHATFVEERAAEHRADRRTDTQRGPNFRAASDACNERTPRRRQSYDREPGQVSVLTPTYQHAALIGDCIRSALAQTVQDWEMVIVDDGSDDGTTGIAESFHDPRIVVLRRQHEGVAGLGRAYACGRHQPPRGHPRRRRYLAGEELEDQLPLFDDPAVVLAYGSAGLMDERGCIYARYSYAPPGMIGVNDPFGTILPALVRLNFIVAATVMVRRSALERIGGFSSQPASPTSTTRLGFDWQRPERLRDRRGFLVTGADTRARSLPRVGSTPFPTGGPTCRRSPQKVALWSARKGSRL